MRHLLIALLILGTGTVSAAQAASGSGPRVERPHIVRVGNAEVLVEALGCGQKPGLIAEVPLTEAAGAVAGVAENLGDGRLIGIQAFLTRGYAANACTRVVAPSEEFGSGGRANLADIEIIEGDALFGE